MASLNDIYGYERASFITAWVAFSLHERMAKGLVTGPDVIDVDSVKQILVSGIEAGHSRPSVDEIDNALKAVRTAYPDFELTPKGVAFAQFEAMQRGIGNG